MARYELSEFKPKKNYFTASHSSGDLIAFGDEIYEKYKDTPCFIQKFQTYEGNAYAIYVLEAEGIVIKEIEVTSCQNEKSKMNVLEDIIYSIRNIAASNKTKLIIKTDNEDVRTFIKKRNYALKEQGIEETYHWKIAP
tara:strand:- start:85 stop:498 length:414 start_codon:yes stop_codon:yes gene_type:complete